MPLALQIALSIVGGDESRESVLFQFDVISAATIGAAADVFSSDITWTADGSTYRIYLYIPTIETGQTANSFVSVHLVDGSGNDLGRMGYVGYADGTRSALQGAFNAFTLYTPSSGSVSINIRMIQSGSNGNASFGAGGAGANMSGYLAVYGPDIT
jgi:hypothetical protein